MFRFLDARTSAERMAELGRFIEFWYGRRAPEYGATKQQLARLSLPHPLRWFYEFAGRWPSPDPGWGAEYFYTGAAGHHLRSLSEVKRGRDGKLSFFMEYQGTWDGLTLPDEEDPPVWIKGYWDDPANDDLDDDERDEMPPREKQVGTLSKFLITHCLMATVYEPANSPSPRTFSDTIDRKLAKWFRKHQSAAERTWEAEPDGCPNYDGAFYLFHQHVLVHQSASGALKFGALHPEGAALLRGVSGEKA